MSDLKLDPKKIEESRKSHEEVKALFEPKFTPGPWSLHQRSDRGSKIISNFKVILKEIYWDNFEEAANADLITSAPDLYEALNNLHEDLNDNYGSGNLDSSTKVLIQRAFYALLKARGENA